MKYLPECCRLDADYTYVWVLKETLNYYLALNNNATRYKHTNIAGYTLTDYERLANDNIEYNHPLQPVLRINSTAYFPYTTSGHYVVIKGMSGNSSSGIYTAVINDPHYDWSNTYNIPISAIFDYNKLHSGYIIHVD